MNKKVLRTLSIGLFVGVVITQFNNCGAAGNPATFALSASSIACTDVGCVTPTTENLKVVANLNGGQFPVPANLTEFNIGGDCNEGGFPYNTIRWELIDSSGVTRRTSAMTGMAGNQPVDSQCVNGRFLIYVNLGAITEDPVNRTGLMNGSVRTSYSLRITIYGQSTPGGAFVPNPAQGSTTVTLQAI